ncbi:MAG: hypothetical protein NTX05_05535 [Fusobacteria bacterium]|nr:hypothetical protein [Fusobacteriota bacterium]
MKALLFTHEKKNSGKATIFSNILLGLILNGERVCVVNIDEDRKLFSYLGVKNQEIKDVYSYVSDCVIADLLAISENKAERLIQWHGMYYSKFDIMLINCSKENEDWVQTQLSVILELQNIFVVQSIDAGEKYLNKMVVSDKKPMIIYNGLEEVGARDFLKFPILKEIAEGSSAGKPYLYFNGEDAKADVLWEFFNQFIARV